jgi:hypothetical protein
MHQLIPLCDVTPKKVKAIRLHRMIILGTKRTHKTVQRKLPRNESYKVIHKMIWGTYLNGQSGFAYTTITKYTNPPAIHSGNDG